MSYDAKVLADSISPDGHRLITVQATFPRFILSEINTHRVFSRNSASSRAIPTEKMIESIRLNPFVPETFNKRVKGMGVGEEMNFDDQSQCRRLWLGARNHALFAAEGLNHIGLDKSRANRLLEPFMWHTAIISSTEWDNFFALRAPEDDEWTKDFPSQPEFQKIAILMRKVMRESIPRELDYNEWHAPLAPTATEDGGPDSELALPMISAGRCARVSYLTQNVEESPSASYARAKRLANDGHLSPFEHVAKPTRSQRNEANFRGWMQLRKMIPNEENYRGMIENRESWDGAATQP